MHMLSNKTGLSGCLLLALHSLRCVTELRCFGGQLLLDFVLVRVLDRAMFNGSRVMMMDLRKSLGMFDRLYRRVVVVLVAFLLHGLGHSFMLCGNNSLVGDSWCNLLVRGGVMMTRLGSAGVSNFVATYGVSLSYRKSFTDALALSILIAMRVGGSRY